MTRQQQYSIVGLGEVLWDLLPAGPQFGGAPANFACHASQLGARAALVSCVGNDEHGEQAIAELVDRRVGTSCVGRCELPTGAVEVSLDQLGQPAYSILEDVAWDQLVWSDQVAKTAAVTDAVCFGTLGQRSDISRETIRQFLAEMPDDALRIFDINLRKPFYNEAIILESLQLANVLKLSDEELPVVAELCALQGSETQLISQLAEKFALKLVALTCGSRGAKLLRKGQLSEQAAQTSRVVDTIGAGDSFTAAMTIGMLAGQDLDAINRRACQVAAYVCSQAGATPVIPQELVSY